jgi:quinoprotein glucose dehydrogenase
LSAAQIRDVIDRGKGFMSSLPNLPLAERDAVTAYLLGLPSSAASLATRVADTSRAPAVRSPYRFRGYERWKDASGYPAAKPPWGTLNAIDLNTGNYLWKIPLGEFAELRAKGVPPTGTEQYGGPIVTAGGLVFIAATQDEKFRAFDKRTGALLWETTLPAAGYATPSTYMIGGRQYVVIAAGGGKLGTKSSDTYVAFALPR